MEGIGDVYKSLDIFVSSSYKYLYNSTSTLNSSCPQWRWLSVCRTRSVLQPHTRSSRYPRCWFWSQTDLPLPCRSWSQNSSRNPPERPSPHCAPRPTGMSVSLLECHGNTFLTVSTPHLAWCKPGRVLQWWSTGWSGLHGRRGWRGEGGGGERACWRDGVQSKTGAGPGTGSDFI